MHILPFWETTGKAMSEKERILIADDSAMNRAILTEMLGDGYEILEAEDGRQAVSILQTDASVDLLLLDIMMPNMDGFDVLTMMNKYHWIDEIPVIMISAENASSFVERAYDLGATDYISRPFDMAVVRRRVINTLMLYAKQKLVLEAKAAKVQALDSGTLFLGELDYMAKDSAFSRRTGFDGRSIKDVAQADVVNAAFSPTKEEIDWANMIIGAYEKAVERGESDLFVNDRFIDPPVIMKAKNILARDAMIQARAK